MTSGNQIVTHSQAISAQQRSRQKQQLPCVLWFTGLSGSGKSSLANAVDQKLFASGHHTFVLDGDNVRHGLNRDLGFSDLDRVENIRRLGEVTKLFTEAGLVVLTAFISPFQSDRQLVRELVGEAAFVEIFLDTPLAICEQRDPKGLYKKARCGEIKQFTGIDSPYEKPPHPAIRLDTSRMDIDSCAALIMTHLLDHGMLR